MKRLNYLDTAKGICMLLIMLGHCFLDTETRQNSLLVIWIYSFHTTTFFIITGILVEYIQEYSRPMMGIILSACKRLLLPYFVFQVLYMLWFCCANGWSNIKWMLNDIVLFVDWNYASWFLLVLFISKIIFLLLMKIRSRAIPAILSVLLFLIGAFAPLFAKPETFIAYDWIYRLCRRVCVAVGFIYVGTLLCKQLKYLKYKTVLVVALLISVITAYANGLVSNYHVVFNNVFLYTVSAIAGAIFVLSLSNHFSNRFITFFGVHSVVALGVHQIIINIIPIKSPFVWFLVVPATYLVILAFLSVKQRITQSASR